VTDLSEKVRPFRVGESVFVTRFSDVPTWTSGVKAEVTELGAIPYMGQPTQVLQLLFRVLNTSAFTGKYFLRIDDEYPDGVWCRLQPGNKWDKAQVPFVFKRDKN